MHVHVLIEAAGVYMQENQLVHGNFYFDGLLFFYVMSGLLGKLRAPFLPIKSESRFRFNEF